MDNPGLTREEFVKKLDETHSTSLRKYKSKEPWSYYDKESEDHSYHDGLYGLASFLRLKDSQEFVKFQQPSKDENGLSVCAPLFIYLPEFCNKRGFSVVIHEKNVVQDRSGAEYSDD